MTIPILIITGDQLRHNYFVNRLGEAFDLRGVVSEAVYKPKIEGSETEVHVLTRHFEQRDQAEERFFAEDRQMQVPEQDRLHISKGDANADHVYEWIVVREPRYLVLYGSSIIRERLLKAFNLRTINMHLGLSPYYRGSGTNFWPLVNGEPELVGVTIHLATLDVDAGAILKQVRPEIEPSDRNHDIGCKAIIAGTHAMISALKAYDAGEIAPLPQAAGGRVYKRADFNVAAVEKMWRNLDEGMVVSYLQDPQRADRYPIIEKPERTR
jgi:folate-dependent phosphoribosylglycinamide formyltransferase PurN